MALILLAACAVVMAAVAVALAVALLRAKGNGAGSSTTEDAGRRSLERDLQLAKDRLELAVRSSGVSIWEYEMLDGPLEKSEPILINFWEPLGHDPAQVPRLFAQAAPLVLLPEDLVRVPREMVTHLDGKTARFELEHQVRHKDGTLQWRLCRGVAVRDGEGKIVRFIGTHVDTTRMKQIEADLQSARQIAERANRAKDEFLANVSHEIRTPMNAILGMTEAALDSSASEHQRRLLSTVHSAAQNLLGIINDLLDVSKIGAGKLILEPTDFSLRALVGDTLRAFAARAQQKGLRLGCDVRSDVPDALIGDVARVRQILMNLIGNAIKFTERGEVALDVAVDGGGDGETVAVRFAVRDTGIGISRDKQSIIFRAFEQADQSTTRKYGGTGLGLTISAQLAAMMGGNITVDSEPGQGSKFVFRAEFSCLPATAVPPLLAGAATLLPTAGLNEPVRARAPSLRILVAEDNEFNVALLREWLGRWHHRGQFVEDGRAALALASEGEFDLLLLDLHMPELDGFEVAQAIRAREVETGAHLPIIALTARSSARDRERCLAAGMDDFLPKPIERDALWAAIDRLGGGRPRASGRATHLLDPGTILGACGGEAEVLKTLGEAFRRGLPERLARVRSALKGGDPSSLRLAAHTLGGSVSVFSTLAASLAITLEEQAASGELAGCAELVDQLEAMCSEVATQTTALTIDALRSWNSGPQGAPGQGKLPPQ